MPPLPEIRTIKGRKEALREAYSKALTAKHSFYCVTGDELARSYKPFLHVLQTRIKQGGDVSSSIITSIDKSTIPAVKDLISAGAQIRHIPISELRRCVIYDNSVAYFSIIEPTITADALDSVDQTEGDDLWISSTEPCVVESAKRRFEVDWKDALPAADRIKELETGEASETIQVIKENNEAVAVYKSLVARARNEVLYLLPAARSLVRVEKAGILEMLVSAARERGTKVRILCPVDSENIDIISYLAESSPHILLRGNEPTTSTVLIVDRQELFTAELQDNNTFDICQAFHFSVYSNSKQTIQSHITLFESLWKQKELYAQLERAHTQFRILYEKLAIQDKMQREFISVAAHELRTPIQPILGIATMLESEFETNSSNIDEKDTIKLTKEELQIIARNARRLQRLSSDILQVARIESNSLQLYKERVNLNDIIQTAIQDAQSRINNNNKNPNIRFDHEPTIVFLDADEQKITQVVCNLVDNSIKFTKDGTISISSKMDKNEKTVQVSIKDTGTGIDQEIISRLFTRFTTRSQEGTGLGLYIAKGIVEAHGGKIWAENNKDEKGATFAFTLPLVVES